MAQNVRRSNARTNKNKDGHVGDQLVPVLGAAAVALHGGSAVGGQVPTTVVVSFPRHGTVVAGPACAHAGPPATSLLACISSTPSRAAGGTAAGRRRVRSLVASMGLVRWWLVLCAFRLDAALSCGSTSSGDVSHGRQLAAPHHMSLSFSQPPAGDANHWPWRVSDSLILAPPPASGPPSAD